MCNFLYFVQKSCILMALENLTWVTHSEKGGKGGIMLVSFLIKKKIDSIGSE